MLLVKKAVMNKNMQKHEIEEFLKNKGDYVKIDLLTKLMKDVLSIDMKKTVAGILGEIYEKKNMNLEAARLYFISATNSGLALEKIKFFRKEAMYYLKAGIFDKADDAAARASSEADAREKSNIQVEMLSAYKKLASENLNKNRLANAIKVLEKMEGMNVSESEMEEIQTKLLKLYEKLGKIERYMHLKNKMENKRLVQKPVQGNRKTF